MAKISFKVGTTTYTGDTVEQVVGNIHKRLRGTSHPFANYNVLYNTVLKQHVEVEKTKSQTPPGSGEHPDAKGVKMHPGLARRLTATEAFNAGKALVKMNLMQKTVDQLEVTRRGDICRQCPKLADTSDCGQCAGARRKLAALAARATSLFQKKLKLGMFGGKKPINSYCGVCGCSMQTLLPVRIQDYKPAAFLKPEDRPDECWLRKDGENFIES